MLITVFAWDAFEHGTDIHSLADPTKLEVMHKEFKVNKGSFKDEQQKSILEQYGGEEHLDAPPKELLLAQTEEYVEYSRLGNVIKGQEKAVTKSRYEEDVFTNNHIVSFSSPCIDTHAMFNPYIILRCLKVCANLQYFRLNLMPRAFIILHLLYHRPS